MPEVGMMAHPLPEIRPNPDPTDRTTDLLRREIQMLKEVIEQRLDGYDRAITLLQNQVDRDPKPPVLASDIQHLKESLVTLGSTVDQRFLERDKRNEQAVRDSKSLVDNTIQSIKDAFAKQNETSQSAISKSEHATAKQKDQIESKFGTEIGAIKGTIDDVKHRLTTLESTKAGMKEQRAENKDMTTVAIAIGGLVISAFAVMFTVYSNTSNNVDLNDVRAEITRQLSTSPPAH